MANIFESGRFSPVRKEFVIIFKQSLLVLDSYQAIMFFLGLFTCVLHDSTTLNLRNEGVRMKRWLCSTDN